MQRAGYWLHGEPLLAVVLWGAIYPGAKIGLQEIPILDFTYLRIILAAFFLLVVSGLGRPRFPSRPRLGVVASAGLAQAAFQILLIAGLRWTTAGISAILLVSAPLLTTGWLALRRRERVSPGHWLGLGLGLAGVALVVRGAGMSLDRSRLLGDVLTLGAAGAWVWYSLAVAPLVADVGTLRATGWAMAVSAIVFTPFALVGVARLPWPGVSWEAWAGLVYGATAGMVVAMALWGRSVHRLGPKTTMLYAYLEPLSAVVIAALLLGESLTALQAAGAVVTFAGVWCAARPAESSRRGLRSIA
jgi:drug/metabolite transporter (DMT)-like permease